MEIDVKKLISTENIKNKIAQDLEEDIVRKITWKLDSELSEAIEIFVKEEIAPTVMEELMGKKEEIITQLKEDVIKIVVAIGETLVATAIKNLDSSWKVKKIVEELFN
jgi:diphthamide biosynthesis methyltransferase